jgi:RNA-directed DNA polymerase
VHIPYLDHELLLKAVTKHTDCKWSLLYIERWLKASVQKPNGIIESRIIGTPQGGVISPLLANLFLHYAFDKWMERNFPQNPYERYADDIVIHTKTKREAENLKRMIQARLAECNLRAHPEKTKIVYCKDSNRKDSHSEIQFTFLGYTFRPREARNKYGTNFTLFSPGVSNESKKKMNQTMRGWKLHLRSNLSLEELAKWVNPILRGWVNYYGRLYKTALYPVFYHLNETLARWIKRKYKKFRRKFQRAIRLLGKIAHKQPKLFAHWEFGFKPMAEVIGAV